MEHAQGWRLACERRACRVVRQWRGTQRYQPLRRKDGDELTQAILALGVKYGRYGYRRITVLLQNAGWPVGRDRVQRIWRREGLKVPQKQRPRGRLWLHDSSCIRLRPERANQVWSYDFVKGMTHDGRALRILVLIDEYTRECLMLRVARRLGSVQVIEALADVMLVRGIPRARSFGQRRVHCEGVAEVVGESGHEDVIHRARESVGERVLRELQRKQNTSPGDSDSTIYLAKVKLVVYWGGCDSSLCCSSWRFFSSGVCGFGSGRSGAPAVFASGRS